MADSFQQLHVTNLFELVNVLHVLFNKANVHYGALHLRRELLL